jgi:dGTPase
VRKRGVFGHDLLDYESYLPDLVKSELEFFKNFIQKNVIKLPEVQMLEYKGEQMIVKLFEALALNPTRLLPLKYKYRYENANTDSEKNRVICDYLAGTTDDYATKIYHKIFTPSSGSIFDKL